MSLRITLTEAGARLRRPLVVSVLAVAGAVIGVMPSCAREADGSARTSDTSTSAQAGGDAVAMRVRDAWVAGIDSLAARVDSLVAATAALDGGPAATRTARQQFDEARVAFKHVEFLAAYYEPSTTASMNGPALPRVEAQEGPEAVFPPEGFQVIEERLFAADDESAARSSIVTPDGSLVAEVENLRALVRRLRTAAAAQPLTDDRVWDAARLQIARVATLGVTGFDSPIAQHSLPEAAAALDGVRAALALYAGALTARDSTLWTALDAAFRDARAMLEPGGAFDDFDRLSFIAARANPLARSVHAARERLALALPVERRAFHARAATLFDSGAIDPVGFASPLSDPDSPARATLGRQLFHEARLSGDGTQSCASCHDPARAFTDGLTRSVSRNGVSRNGVAHAGDATPRMRNTPTVINAGLQNGSFYDLRTAFLEDQVTEVLVSRHEMHSSASDAASRLAADASYRSGFETAFGAQGDSTVSGTRLRTALAAYLRSLNGVNSRVDQAMRGDVSRLSAEERLGFNLFTGKAKCATCHFIPVFNGSVPPAYRSTDVEILGVPARAVTRNARVDADSGRFRITHAAPHLFAFKTPGLRNVALTAPYMHNGVYRTLEEVVDFYDRGGGAGIGIALPNQTLPTTPLRLSTVEQRALVALMRALTDTTGLTARP